MAKVVVKSVTEARNQFFDLVNAAYYAGQETVLEKNRKRVARVVPMGDVGEKAEVDWEEQLAIVRSLKGKYPDFPTLEEIRNRYDGSGDKIREMWSGDGKRSS